MKINNIKKNFNKFWHSDNEKISILRDILVAFLVVFILLMILWTYTGQWFGAPMVAIESGSMMHLDEEFGRIGYIDAGDMVLLVKVNYKSDILTRGSNLGGEQAKGLGGYKSYGDFGDVIIYKKYGKTDEDQIIHRAICWIEYNEDKTYSVSEYGIENENSVTIKELGLNNYRPLHSGFITQGDNPITNDRCDQAGGICGDPIKPEWITGKARFELPWIGTINLLFNDLISGSFWNNNEITVFNVPTDSLICLIILLAIIISIPILLDIYDYRKRNS